MELSGKTSGLVLAVGGALLGAGSFLPWFTVQGQTTSAYSWGDGWFILFSGVILVTLGVAIRSGRTHAEWLGWVVASLAGLLVLINFREFTGVDGVGVQIGVGIWTMLIGVVIALVAMIMGRKEA